MGHITLHMGIGWVLEATVYIWVTCRTVYGMKEGSSVYGQFSDLGWHEGKICSSGTPLYYTLQRLVVTMCKICSMISSDGTPTPLWNPDHTEAGKRLTKDLINLGHCHCVVFTNIWFNTPNVRNGSETVTFCDGSVCWRWKISMGSGKFLTPTYGNTWRATF